ncbi:MAG TPA: uracil-DNA glycosylase [Candidatus Bathyarchaeia archaeon]
MSELALMNKDMIDATMHLSTEQILDLNKEVVECRACRRLVEYRESVARVKKKRFLGWNYWGRPVPGFGDVAASIFVIGLAPAAHGGNRTGRVFTGDRSADFLVKALFDAGYANQPRSIDVNDGLKLRGIYMTAAVKCVPPDNKPKSEEMLNCAHFLESELEICNKSRVILCLGQFAYRSTMTLLRKNNLFTSKIPRFEHGLEINLLDGRKVVASYHPSPRNTQTGTLTADMLNSLFQKIGKDLSRPS